MQTSNRRISQRVYLIAGITLVCLGVLLVGRLSSATRAASLQLAAAPTAGAVSAGAPPVERLAPDDMLRVHVIDVGQGDSILIQAPDSTTALIDGGYDNGQALAYMRAQGITKIDLLIASHPHADHIGGLVEVLRALPVGAVWTSGSSHTTGTYEAFLDAIAAAKVPYYEAATGDTIGLGELNFEVLYGDASAPDLNDTSLVLRLEYGQVSFLFTGDAERATEEKLLESVPDQLAATILKVGHHGSYTSSSPRFLAAVHPNVAIYSAGRGNSYGHPHESTISALQAAGASIYGTDTSGTVIVSTDGTNYRITPAREIQPAPPPVAVPATSTGPALPSAIPAMPPGTLRYDPNGPDRDCGAFATYDEAHAFYLAAGGPAHDPHRLDGDSDGRPCESLPAALPTAQPGLAATPTVRYDPAGRDRDCGSFATHAEAQTFFTAAGGPARDPHRLDGDNDGIACESLP